MFTQLGNRKFCPRQKVTGTVKIGMGIRRSECYQNTTTRKPVRIEIDWSSDPNLFQRFQVWHTVVREELDTVLSSCHPRKQGMWIKSLLSDEIANTIRQTLGKPYHKATARTLLHALKLEAIQRTVAAVEK